MRSTRNSLPAPSSHRLYEKPSPQNSCQPRECVASFTATAARSILSGSRPGTAMAKPREAYLHMAEMGSTKVAGGGQGGGEGKHRRRQ